jgi:nuclear pore complex protein Nup188
MVYSVTQLALWLAKPELDTPGGGEADPEDAMMADGPRDGAKDRKAKRTTIAERLSRGMSGEMADDLESLLKTGKAALQEHGADSKQNLAAILLNFFKNHLRN